jgi:hypothetical protein
MFIAKHQGAFQLKIRWVYDFLVHIQITTSDWEYLKCIKLEFHILFSSPILCLRQEQGNNLCGYYVCEHIHHHNGKADDDSVSKLNLYIILSFFVYLIAWCIISTYLQIIQDYKKGRTH